MKVVSERLGHGSPAFTMTVYQHVLPSMQADAGVTFSDAVFGGEVPQEKSSVPSDRPARTKAAN